MPMCSRNIKDKVATGIFVCIQLHTSTLHALAKLWPQKTPERLHTGGPEVARTNSPNSLIDKGEPTC